jgi:hypothetical protein
MTKLTLPLDKVTDTAPVIMSEGSEGPEVQRPALLSR